MAKALQSCQHLTFCPKYPKNDVRGTKAGATVSDAMLKEKAKEIALNIPDMAMAYAGVEDEASGSKEEGSFTASHGWLAGFKKRNFISHRRSHGESCWRKQSKQIATLEA